MQVHSHFYMQQIGRRPYLFRHNCYLEINVLQPLSGTTFLRSRASMEDVNGAEFIVCTVVLPLNGDRSED